MSEKSNIQWCDSTVNPVMGCDGCPLFPPPHEVANKIAKQLGDRGIDFNFAKKVLKLTFARQTLTNLYFLRDQIAESVVSLLEGIEDSALDETTAIISDGIKNAVKCYAAILHIRMGDDPTNPEKIGNEGYAPNFETVTRFKGRMAQSARLSNLRGEDRVGSPWLNGLPRLIFVSDMGDALSNGVPFEYLKEEIINVAASVQGQNHVWLWLTKRPTQMLKFSNWLEGEGIPWPDNLVPMTTVMDQSMVQEAMKLLEIPAKAHGLSVEPLWEELNINLQGFSWVIVGGESGSSAEPFHLDWARSLRDQCHKAGVAFFMKQLGENAYENGKPYGKTDHVHGGDWYEWPKDLQIREFPDVFQTLGIQPESQSNRSAQSTPPEPSAEEKESFERYDAIVKLNRGNFTEVGKAMLEIRKGKLWVAGGFRSWNSYCVQALGCSKTYVNRLIKAAEVVQVLVPIGTADGRPLPANESQVRPLLELKTDEQKAQAWNQAVERAKGGQPTANDVAMVVSELLQKPPKSPGSVPKIAQQRKVLDRLKTAIQASVATEQLLEILDELQNLIEPAKAKKSEATAPEAASIADQNGDESKDSDEAPVEPAADSVTAKPSARSKKAAQATNARRKARSRTNPATNIALGV